MSEDGDSYFSFVVERFIPSIVNLRQVNNATGVLQEFSTDKKVAVDVDLSNDTTIRHTHWDGPRSVQPYPIWRRPATDYAWQHDQREMTDHQGCAPCQSYSGLDFLIAYYIGRDYNFITAAQ